MSLTKVSYSMTLGSPLNVLDFGADPTGVSNSTTAIQAAIDSLATTGGEIYIPEGTYLLNGTAGADSFANGIIVPNRGEPNNFGDHITIRGAGKSTVLKAGSNNMFVFRFCDSQGIVEKLAIDGNGKTNVRGLGVCPANISTGTTVTNVYLNSFKELSISSCNEGIYLQSGPTNGVLASVTGLNRFRDINIYNSDRGIWLGGGFSGVSGSNRNQFQSIYISAGSRGNTGVQIDDGDTNTFINVDCETMVVGATPNATPTCYYIAQTGASGLDNNFNRFIGCVAESVVRTLNNNNVNTEFYSCVFPAGTLLLTAKPRIMIGDDASSTPQILPGYQYQLNTYLAGVPNGYLYPNRILSANGYSFPAVAVAQADPNTLDDYEEGIWTATDASGASLSLTSGGGMYVKVGQLVMAAVSVTYPITADASPAIIGGLPFVCQSNSGFSVFGGAITFTDSSLTMSCNVSNNASTVRLAITDGNNVTNANLSGEIVRYCVVYRSTN